METNQIIASSQEAFRHFLHNISPYQEEIWVLGLNRQLTPIETVCCFRGTVDSCTIHPRELFAPLISMRASHFIMAHNHPRGTPEPSQRDIEVTQIIEKASRLMMIPLLDHIIIAQDEFVSLHQRGLIKPKYQNRVLL
jgi:DNA repair protein RadC